MADRLQRSLRVTFIGMTVNAFLSVGKIGAGLLGHSHALVADGVESLADLLSSVIVWRGVTVAAAPADEEHPYGHGKAEPIATAVVAGILIGAAIWIVLGAVRDILTPHSSPAPFTLVVLVGVVAVKELLFRFVLREAQFAESSVIHADAWHHRSDAITSIFAFIGISVALIGGPGYEVADDYAAIVAGGVVAWNGFRLLRPALNELMDVAADPAFSIRLVEIASAVPGVAGVEKCLARKSGNEYHVDMHIEVDPLMTVAAAHDIAHRVKDGIKSELAGVRDVLVHIEPARSGGQPPASLTS